MYVCRAERKAMRGPSACDRGAFQTKCIPLEIHQRIPIKILEDPEWTVQTLRIQSSLKPVLKGNFGAEVQNCALRNTRARGGYSTSSVSPSLSSLLNSGKNELRFCSIFQGHVENDIFQRSSSGNRDILCSFSLILAFVNLL